MAKQTPTPRVREILYRIFGCLRKALAIRKHRKLNVIGRAISIGRSAKIGKQCIIGDRSLISSDTIIGNNVRVGTGVRLERISIGDNSEFSNRALITGFGSGRITVGHDSYIGPDTALDFSADIIIGDYVHIAGLSTGLWTHSSALMCLRGIALADKSETNRPTAPIVIEDNVYIGGNCTIYPGVKIGHHCVVAPNSAVCKDVAPYSMVGGVPARFIKDTREMVCADPESAEHNEAAKDGNTG
ncbi:MAG TPA: DapH/DapD/GlmU-related protein [Candidatus Syntrophosphaera sp.]|nr:DapH/DapD/GlmU-related protein [Candidatus Syntrophosphaera sp.]